MSPGVPQVVAMVGAASLLLAATVAVTSLPLAWWASEDPPGKGITSPSGADSTSQIWSYEITLWGMTVESRTDEQDGSLTYSTGSTSWGEGCSKPDSRLFSEVPQWCGRINLLRACVFLTIIFALAGVGVFMYALMKQILLLLVGGLFATITAIFALAATIFCIMQRNSDLSTGPLLMITTVLLAAVGVMISIYGAAQAADDVEEALKGSRVAGTRQRRAEESRKKEEEDYYYTKSQEEAWSRRREEEDSDDGVSASGEKPKKEKDQKRPAPTMLQHIIFWSQENQEDEDAQIDPKWLHIAFQQIDQDQSGVIDITELVDALQLCGLNVSHEASELIMSEIDKNNDGEISRDEFVKFFQNVEELNRYQKRKERRAQFATFVMNCCFLSDIIIVATLVMAVINMERSGGGSEDDRVILTNLLYATGLLLGVLFCMVVAWPALRLTLTPSLNAWDKYYGAELEKRRRRKKQESEEKERMNESKPSLKHSAISATGEVAPVPINAAVMGASYRVNKVQAIMDSTQGSAQALANSQNARRASLRASFQQPGQMALPDGDVDDGSTGLEGLSQPGQVMDMDEDLMETMDRYSYARHHYSSIQAPKSFQPFQLQLPEVVKKDAEELGHRDRRIASLTDGSYTFNDSRG